MITIRDNDFLFVANTSIHSQKIIEELQGRNIIIISSNKFQKLIKETFQTISLSEKFSSENEHFALMRKDLLEKKINKEDLIENIIEDYREKRG